MINCAELKGYDMIKNTFTPFPELKSERLLFQKLEIKDAEALFDYQSNKSNFPFVQMTIYKELEEAVNYIHKMNHGVEDDKWIIWGLYLKETEEMIGTVSIWNLNNETHTAEFGYGLFPKYRGQGYMTEALKRCIIFGFDEMNLLALEAYTNVANKVSIQLLEQTGFVYTDTITESDEDMAIYKIKGCH